MRIGSLGLAMLAFGVALPALAQQSIGSQQQARQQQVARQQVETWVSEWGDAYNRGDANTVFAMSDANACTIDITGKVCGLTNMEQRLQEVMKMGPHLDLKVDEVRPTGQNAATALGSYRVTFTNNPASPRAEGNWLAVLERQGTDWKAVASSFTRIATSAPAVATGSTGAQPATGTSTPPAPAAGPKYDPTTGQIK